MSRKKHRIIAKCYDKRGRLISKGENSYVQTHPVQAHWARLVGQPERVYLHAEIKAIISARGKAIHKIKIERYDSRGNEAPSCPCPVCFAAIHHAGIKVVEFFT